MRHLPSTMMNILFFILLAPTLVRGFAPSAYPSTSCQKVATISPLIPHTPRPLATASRRNLNRGYLIGYHHDTTALPTTSDISSTRLHVIAPDQMIAWTSMGLLAIQFGAMPTLQKKCVPRKLCRSSMVLAQEVSKFALAASCFVLLINPIQRHQALATWSIRSWWKGAGIPAALYAIQNYAKLLAYQHLSPLYYSVLNQTKTLSTAFFCFWLLGIPQSPLQILSLLILLTSALVMEQVIPIRWPDGRQQLRISPLHWKGRLVNHTFRRHRRSKLFACVVSSEKDQQDIIRPPITAAAVTRTTPDKTPTGQDQHHFTCGVLPLLLANLTSGLAAALGQRALQRRNLFLYGMELSSASFLLVLASLFWSKDGKQIRKEGWRHHWTGWVWIPIAAHAIGGQLVGLVTKYAGSVQKGFSLIFGVLLSGIFQKQWLHHEPVTREQIVGGLLACFSLWMHAAFPPSPVAAVVVNSTS